MKFFLLILKNLRRNVLRTLLTCLATMTLVYVVTSIWTTVYFLDKLTEFNTGNLKAVVIERWQMPSRMPLSYAVPLGDGGARKPQDKKPKDSMSWQFYIGSLDFNKKTRENLVAMVAMDVRKLPQKKLQDGKAVVTRRGIMEDLDPIDEALVQKLAETTHGCLIGQKRLKMLNKRVGERFKVHGVSLAGIDLEFEIIGVLPEGLWSENAFMNERYLNNALDAYRGPGGGKHPLDQRRLNMMWVEVDRKEDFPQVVEQINTSPAFSEVPIRCLTVNSLTANMLDSYSDFIWFIQWVLVPGSMFSMILLISNAISLNVHERIKEMAMLKVLGFQPWQLLVLVLGEGILIGLLSGFFAGAMIFSIANLVFGGIPLPGSQPFPIPATSIIWGVGVGSITALIGSIMPAWTAWKVKAAEMLARVT